MDVESEDYSEVERESLRDRDDSPAHDGPEPAAGMSSGQPVQRLAVRTILSSATWHNLCLPLSPD